MVQKENDKKCDPFLKWAGGKRWLLSRHSFTIPNALNKYIEPFMGSGAIFFQLHPKEAILSDINKELMDTYRAIKENWQRVFKKLQKHHKLHNKEYYYEIRKSRPQILYDRAARFIYLNRTCWNGLYRVNLKGEFNVPIGTKTTVVREQDNFDKISKLLEKATILDGDFEGIINKADKDDLVFVDPPYTILHDDNGFTKYNEKLFRWEDQIRLRDCLKRAKDRGSKIIVTNASHNSIKKLYESEFNITEIQRCSIIAASSEKRKSCKELIITNFI